MRCELVVTGLDRFQTFCRFSRLNNNQDWRKTRRDEGIENGLGVSFANIDIGDDGATRAELQARAFTTEPVNQARRDFDVVAAAAQ